MEPELFNLGNNDIISFISIAVGKLPRILQPNHCSGQNIAQRPEPDVTQSQTFQQKLIDW